MLARRDDPSTIGGSLAIALLSALYGVGLSELVYQPLKHVLITKTADAVENVDRVDSGQSKSNRWLVLGLGVFAGIIPILLVLIAFSLK